VLSVGEEGARRVRIPPRDDLEKVASMAAEKAALMVSKGLLEEMKRIRESLERVEVELKALREMLQERGKGRYRLGERLVEELKTRGYIVVSEAYERYRTTPENLVEEGVRAGALVITAGGNAILIDRSSLEEFKTTIKNIKTSDPVEAIEASGKYAKLFEILNKAGIVYYDGKTKGWIVIS
jgi:predicted nuclease with TOPRIM domain